MSTSPVFLQTVQQNTVTSSTPSVSNVNCSEVDIATWLKQVAYFSDSSAQENLDSLFELARMMPTLDANNPDQQEVIKSMQTFAPEKKFDPHLSPNSLKVLNSITVQLKTKPKCAKKLFN